MKVVLCVFSLLASISVYANQNYVEYPWGKPSVEYNAVTGDVVENMFIMEPILDGTAKFTSKLIAKTNKIGKYPKTFISNGKVWFGYNPSLPSNYLKILSKIAPENVVEVPSSYKALSLKYPFTNFCVIRSMSLEADKLETVFGEEGEESSIEVLATKYNDSQTANQVYSIYAKINSWYNSDSESSYMNCYFANPNNMTRQEIIDEINATLHGYISL